MSIDPEQWASLTASMRELRLRQDEAIAAFSKAAAEWRAVNTEITEARTVLRQFMNDSMKAAMAPIGKPQPR